MCAAVSAIVLFLNEHASISARTTAVSSILESISQISYLANDR